VTPKFPVEAQTLLIATAIMRMLVSPQEITPLNTARRLTGQLVNVLQWFRWPEMMRDDRT
jgi:hypothetical protein